MESSLKQEKVIIKRSFTRARTQKPTYTEFYGLLEALFMAQVEARGSIKLLTPNLRAELVQTKWESGFPLFQRMDFPIDAEAAESLLVSIQKHIPKSNEKLHKAIKVLSQALDNHPAEKMQIWRSFLQHEWEPWEEWLDTTDIDVSSLLLLARSCMRPSIVWTAEEVSRKFPVPGSWFKGYCPICGSLPALLFLQGQGERRAHCSWCATQWGMHRLQCPYCDNRYHESLGYISIESEPLYRVQYCNLCKSYFKLIDTREMADFPYLPLEEWTTLHLDILAQEAGWKQPPSPSPVVYGKGDVQSG